MKWFHYYISVLWKCGRPSDCSSSCFQEGDLKDNAKKKAEKESKFKEAKKAMKRNFKVNTKMTFTEDGEVGFSILRLALQ